MSTMVYALWIFGSLAVLTAGVLMFGLLCLRNQSYRDKAGKPLFLVAFTSTMSIIIWVALALIHWWHDWIAYGAGVLLLLYVASPDVNKNNDGEWFITWFNMMWIKRNGRWMKQ